MLSHTYHILYVCILNRKRASDASLLSALGSTAEIYGINNFYIIIIITLAIALVQFRTIDCTYRDIEQRV